MNTYLIFERLVVDVIKEVLFVSLVFFLAYRILVDMPLEGPFDEWSRLILLVLGYLLIPGCLIKIYLFVTGMTKDK